VTIRSKHRIFLLAAGLAALQAPLAARAEAPEAYKTEALAEVDAKAKLVQEMVDSIYSFAEPGFQEFKTSEYITGILEENGFTIERGVAGIPTAFTATWSNGTGGPKIALGSDIDALLGLSQVPGETTLKAQVEGAPGHGEGHNSGMPAIVAAALAAKEVMEKNGLSGTLMIWPGIAEELLATKAFFVRDGMFDGVDASIFLHVSPMFGTAWGKAAMNGMVSVEYSFSGKTAHGASPWEGKSALDAVEWLNLALNMRREHLFPTQRMHYVITEGGGQPNIVPDKASVWYYFREQDFQSIADLYAIGNQTAEAAAKATDTSVSRRLLGYAAPNHSNRPLAEAAYKNIERIGMPEWSAADQAFARKLQEDNGRDIASLATEVAPLGTPSKGGFLGGGSDDIGDVMWTVPTITIGYPSNVPNVIYHNKLAAMAMATPIAHKGAVAGAKATALTILDLVTTPELVAEAKKYQQEVQFAEDTYAPVLTAEDTPGIHLNAEIMDSMRPKMEPLYYDPTRFSSYLEQLGIDYEAAGAE